MPFSRAVTYKLIDAGLISSVVVSWPGSKRGRRLIDGDSLDAYLEMLTAKQAMAPGHGQNENAPSDIFKGKYYQAQNVG
jgi:hypothetical protein